MQVQLVQKGQLLEAILEQNEAVHKDGWHVATSPRCDVPTSRRWVNYYAGQQAATSRRLNVATSQRRDVSASAVFSSFKRKQDADFGVSGNVRTRAHKSEQQRHRSGRRARDLYCFFVFDNRTDVLYITY